MSNAQCVVLLVAIVMGGVGVGSAAEPFSPVRIAVYFSPSGGATDAVVRAVSAAQQQLLVPAYSFTSAPIAKVLGDAHTRSANVLTVLDPSRITPRRG